MILRRYLNPIAATALLLSLTACADTYNPGQRAAGGALIGGGTGAALGGLLGGGQGALLGGLFGGGAGALTGYATTPQYQNYGHQHYGQYYGGGYSSTPRSQYYGGSGYSSPWSFWR